MAMPKGVLRSHATASGPWLQSSLWGVRGEWGGGVVDDEHCSDGHTAGHCWSAAPTFPLEKMVQNALASSPTPQLLSYLLLQLFPRSCFILGLRGPSGYLPNIC